MTEDKKQEPVDNLDRMSKPNKRPLPSKWAGEYELKVEDDDDIQDYKKPWVGLTYEDQEEIVLSAHSIRDAINKTDQKLKEKNT